MIILGRIKEITTDWIKLLVYGKDDVRTAPQVAPYGVVSKPIKGKIGLYLETEDATKSVFLGCVSVPDSAMKDGEVKIRATDDNGVEQGFVYCHNEEVGSADDWAVKFSGLEQAFNTLKDEYDGFVEAFLTHTNGGYPTTVTPPATSPLPSLADITLAKNKKITTNN